MSENLQRTLNILKTQYRGSLGGFGHQTVIYATRGSIKKAELTLLETSLRLSFDKAL